MIRIALCAKSLVIIAMFGNVVKQPREKIVVLMARGTNSSRNDAQNPRGK